MALFEGTLQLEASSFISEVDDGMVLELMRPGAGSGDMIHLIEPDDVGRDRGARRFRAGIGRLGLFLALSTFMDFPECFL